MANEQYQSTGFDEDREGCGLQLRVTQTAAGVTKAFQQRMTLRGKQITVGIGTYPQITLSEAREKAITNIKLVRDDENPPGD